MARVASHAAVWMKTTDSAGVELRFVHAAWMEPVMRRLWEEPTAAGETRFAGPFESPVLTQAGLLDFGRRKDPVTGKATLGWKSKEKFLTGPERDSPTASSTSTRKAPGERPCGCAGGWIRRQTRRSPT